MNTKPDHFTCDNCKQVLPLPLYSPVKSLRHMAVFECPNCFLCQSKSLQPFQRDPTRTLSCDSDWGNVRHGKGARFSELKNWLSTLNFSGMKTALDVGANRGDFVLWLIEHHPHMVITAVEPDAGVVSKYAGKPNVQLITERYERTSTPPVDFIYSVHTLEHATSAVEMLERNFAALKPGGLLLLEVPNLAAIADKDNVEEFFIDKHAFHFSREVLINLVQAVGFRIVRDSGAADIYNITLLLTPGVTTPPKAAWSAREQIDNYRSVMVKNRAMLRRVVAEKLSPLAARQKVGYWGAGRIFNALVKYGKLPREEVHCLVDRHLWKIVDNNEGIPINRPESLKQSEPQVLVILGRSSAEAMRKEAHAMGIRHVVMFNDLLAAARSASRADERGCGPGVRPS